MLQTLLDEGVPIRDLVRIFEALSLKAPRTKDPDALVEAARAALGPAIAAPYLVDGTLHVMTFDPQLEQRLLETMRQGDAGPVVGIDPDTGGAMITELLQRATEMENRNLRPVLVCAPQVRAAVRRLVGPTVPRLAVLSYQEVTGATRIESEAVITAPAGALA